MKKSLPLLSTAMLLVCALVLRSEGVPQNFQAARPTQVSSPAYLGFDRNEYPGDAVLGLLRETFSFSGYWLNMPPGEVSNTWRGKREILNANGFGFLVLFNGRLERELKSPPAATMLGARDAAAAVQLAETEGFPRGTIIFLDQEEGGRMLPVQRSYIYTWADRVSAGGYQAGIYCSGIPVNESGGTTIITANDLRDYDGGRNVIFFVYNDACSPSIGCAFPRNPPPPRQSGVPFAAVWQFAQSPRRRALTASCPSEYASDGNCYAPLLPPATRVHLDVDSATSPDPSSGRR